MRVDVSEITAMLDGGNRIIQEKFTKLFYDLHSQIKQKNNADATMKKTKECFAADMLQLIDKKLDAEYDEGKPSDSNPMSEIYRKLYRLSGYKYFLGNLQATIKSELELTEMINDYANAAEQNGVTDIDGLKSFMSNLHKNMSASQELEKLEKDIKKTVTAAEVHHVRHAGR